MKSPFITAVSFLPLIVGVGVMMAAFNLGSRASTSSLILLSLLLWVLGTALWVATRIALANGRLAVRVFVWLGWYPGLLVSWVVATNQSSSRRLLGVFVALSVLGWVSSSLWLRSHRQADI